MNTLSISAETKAGQAMRAPTLDEIEFRKYLSSEWRFTQEGTSNPFRDGRQTPAEEEARADATATGTILPDNFRSTIFWLLRRPIGKRRQPR